MQTSGSFGLLAAAGTAIVLLGTAIVFRWCFNGETPKARVMCKLIN